ncbi:MAG: polysaccharide biosynthesis tyrosine autokinase, partial [Actinomycetota bacterium]
TSSIALGVGDVLEAASTPEQPFSPDHPRNGALGLFAGAILGIGVAFIRERLDDRFRGRPDVERVLEAPVLATVPRFAHGKRFENSLPVLSEPKGPASEAYRNLRTGFQFLASQRGYQTLLVTSPSAHEGKTSTVANLGVALSQAGRRVVIVSADLRRPNLERTFGAQNELGLSSWLLGEEDDLRKLVLEHPDIPNLSLMTAGRVPSNPAELLTSPRLRELIDRLTQYFDLVLFDSPPVLPVADAVILASHLDSVILIFDAASTGRNAALHAKEQIERVGGTIIGCVLNAFDPSNTPYYYEPHYYSAYYGPHEDESGSGDGETASNFGVEDEEDMLDARRRRQK